ncbi:hypothetical protein C7S14_7728 [Burkholderia cepacia]|nr:hypothetical protein C7S14_7728 [Burkholderia cepacia]
MPRRFIVSSIEGSSTMRVKETAAGRRDTAANVEGSTR